MKKTLETFKKKKGVNDSNEGTLTTISVGDDGDELFLSVRKTTDYVKSVGNNKRKEEEDLIIDSLSPDNLATIVELLDDWLETDSKPQFTAEIESIDGKYTKEIPSAGMGGTPRTTNQEFEEIQIKVDESYADFHFWDEQEREFRGLSIPAAKKYTRGTPSGYNHILTLNQFFHEFFQYQFDGDPASVGITTEAKKEIGPVQKVEKIFENFDKISRQLSQRDRDRDPLILEDEHDVQYLLHAILRIDFNDIRDETYLKQHSTVSPRIDFLLEEHEIGIEVKYASKRNDAKELRNQLFEDKEQYRGDPNCQTLLCFIYDPDRVLTNPVELEKDLSESQDNLLTRLTVTQS